MDCTGGKTHVCEESGPWHVHVCRMREMHVPAPHVCRTLLSRCAACIYGTIKALRSSAAATLEHVHSLARILVRCFTGSELGFLGPGSPCMITATASSSWPKCDYSICVKLRSLGASYSWCVLTCTCANVLGLRNCLAAIHSFRPAGCVLFCTA